ncbi:hypothetical protein Q4603_20370 [Zobellia galactanivorans]|uniref:hypothetical protein n=1 Tax=Zobellia galactanivorans (strain DSM 12802 / CCUG 47099 / CIP 106680 / NCIMB 13871 / Dsij) TaxID=63186 RepID=UPI0026E1668C|nr:hypothetical protein [Zobellia galactanivorans]MDO6810987.1 hypothetical protein [Zobellia galactanivorans]
MEVWLKKIRPPKYLRYFFFIIYRWYSSYSSEKPTAQYTAAIFLAIPHTFIYILICSLSNVQRISKGNMLLFISFILVLHYYLFLYKAKWKGFLKEFKHLDKKKRVKGTFLVFLYLIFCFFIAIYSAVIRSNENSDSYKLETSISNSLDTYGIAKCLSIQKESSSNFVFFEFYIDDRRVLGATAIEAVDESLINKYFKVKYSSKKINESKLLLNQPVTDTNAIKAAGFTLGR